MIKFVVILALFALFAAAYGTKCYLCRGDDRPPVERDATLNRKEKDWYEDLKADAAFLNSPFCSDKIGDKYDCPEEQPVCVKAKLKSGRTTRACNERRDIGCTVDNSGKSICYCDTDLCNTAPLQRSPSMILLGAVGVLTFLFNALASRLN